MLSNPENTDLPDRDPPPSRERKRWFRSPFLYLPFVALVASLVVFGVPSSPEKTTLQIAVASNFHSTALKLAERFEEETGIGISLSPGSTGKHFAQIVSGAPYDLFLAADAKRPTRLQELGIGIEGTRTIYAIGRLVLVSPRENQFETPWQRLESGEYRHLAVPNPRHAPYGRAAREVLSYLRLDELPPDRLVMGENVSQTWHFLRSGHAGLGFVALSQLLSEPGSFPGDREIVFVPEDWHSPIIQEVILLEDREEGRAFLRFLFSDEAGALIRESGYQLAKELSDAAQKSGEAAP